MYFLRLAHQRAPSSRRYLTPLPPSNVAFSALNLSLGLVANGGAANLGGSRPFRRLRNLHSHAAGESYFAASFRPADKLSKFKIALNTRK